MFYFEKTLDKPGHDFGVWLPQEGSIYPGMQLSFSPCSVLEGPASHKFGTITMKTVPVLK